MNVSVCLVRMNVLKYHLGWVMYDTRAGGGDFINCSGSSLANLK